MGTGMSKESEFADRLEIDRREYEKTRETVTTGMHWARTKVIELFSRILAESSPETVIDHVRELARYAPMYLRAKASAVRVLMLDPSPMTFVVGVEGEIKNAPPICVDGVDGFVVEHWRSSSPGKGNGIPGDRTTFHLYDRNGLEICIVVAGQSAETLDQALRAAQHRAHP